jgi:hypothetical protein
MSLLKFKNAMLSISGTMNTKWKKLALASAGALMIGIAGNMDTKWKKLALASAGALMLGIANTKAVLVSGSWVILEASDLAVVSLATQAYATTSLEIFKLLWFIVIIWWVKYIISKVLWLFGWSQN